MSVRSSLIVLLLFTLVACAPSTRPSPDLADIEKEEQAVYAVFFRDFKGPALILQHTSTGYPTDTSKELIQNSASSLNGISAQTVDGFLQRNAESILVPDDMQVGVEYTILTEEELARISRQPNWGQVLRETYPGAEGYRILSRVGFNAALDQALVYVGFVGGPLVGDGSYYLLEKQDDVWVIIDETSIWIS